MIGRGKSELPNDVLGTLQEAAKPNGFTPHSASIASLLGLLQGRGFVHRSENAPVWHITEAGRAILTGAAQPSNDDLAAVETLRRAEDDAQ